MLPTFLEDLKSEYQAYSVLEQNDDHKGEQYRKTDGVDHTLNLGRDFLACHHLDENGNEPSAVKRGEWHEVHKSEVHTDKNGDIKKLKDAFRRGIAYRRRYANRTRYSLKGVSSCNKIYDRLPAHTHNE